MFSLSSEWLGEAVSIVSDREQLEDSGSGINDALGVSGGMFVFPPLQSSCDDVFSECIAFAHDDRTSLFKVAMVSGENWFTSFE